MKYKLKPEFVQNPELTSKELIDTFINLSNCVDYESSRVKGFFDYRLNHGVFGPTYGDIVLEASMKDFDNFICRYQVCGFDEPMKKHLSTQAKKEIREIISLNQEVLDSCTVAPKPVKRNVGKYATMIRTIYTHFPEGMKYMDIVELLYTGENGFWTKKERHERRGYGATNLCGMRHWQTRAWARPGILYQWFKKVNGKWVPKQEMKEIVFGKDFQPFKKYIGALI